MMSVQTTLLGYKNVLNVYLPLFSSSGMTISYLWFGGGAPRRHNDANFLKHSLEASPKRITSKVS